MSPVGDPTNRASSTSFLFQPAPPRTTYLVVQGTLQNLQTDRPTPDWDSYVQHPVGLRIPASSLIPFVHHEKDMPSETVCQEAADEYGYSNSGTYSGDYPRAKLLPGSGPTKYCVVDLTLSTGASPIPAGQVRPAIFVSALLPQGISLSGADLGVTFPEFGPGTTKIRPVSLLP